MRASRTQYVDGTSALAMREETCLRLMPNAGVVTSRKHSTSTKKHTMNMPLVWAITLVLVMGALSTIVSNVRHSAAQSLISSMPMETVCVVPGDTLWTVAQNHEVSGASTQDVVEWLKVYNDLPSSTLRPGQRLVVPMQANTVHK